jgi:hypothetical protein
MPEQDLNVEQRPGQRLHLEMGTPMMLHLEGMDAQVRTVFVGMEVGKYFILSLPRMSDFEDLLWPGNQAVLRYINAGKVYGFETKVLAMFYKVPIRALYLAYPPQVEILNLRQALRVDCYLPALARCHDTEVKGAILDIGSKGIRFGSTQCGDNQVAAVQPDDPVLVSCYFPGQADLLNLPCLVKNVHMGPPMTTLGLAFAEVSAEVIAAIEKYLARVAEYLPDQ